MTDLELVNCPFYCTASVPGGRPCFPTLALTLFFSMQSYLGSARLHIRYPVLIALVHVFYFLGIQKLGMSSIRYIISPHRAWSRHFAYQSSKVPTESKSFLAAPALERRALSNDLSRESCLVSWQGRARSGCGCRWCACRCASSATAATDFLPPIRRRRWTEGTPPQPGLRSWDSQTAAMRSRCNGSGTAGRRPKTAPTGVHLMCFGASVGLCPTDTASYVCVLGTYIDLGCRQMRSVH